MKAAWAITLGIILIVLGMLFYPTLNGYIHAVDRTGFLPLLSSMVVLLPYGFLFFVVYAIVKKRGTP
jgi:hypothetical protein